MKKWLFSPGSFNTPQSVAMLGLRLGFGAFMLIGHGLPKWRNFTTAKESFPVPPCFDSFLTNETSLLLTIGAEVLAASLLILGLLTRPAALVLSLTMLVAAFSVHAQGPMFLPAAQAKEPALLYAMVFGFFLSSGAGRLSIDRMIRN